jgi:hypothetical protein
VAKKALREHDPNTLKSDLDRVLAALANFKQQGSDWLTATQISASLRDGHGIGIHWRRIESLLQNNRDLVDRRKRDRHWQYMVLRAGLDRLSSTGSSIVFVDPGKALQATLSLHSFLQSLSGTARICDPYLDPTTLDHLSACTLDLAIRFLTKNIKDSSRVRTLLAAARTEGRNIEVRVAPSAPLHDRYVIDDKKMLILGTSLNGFGKKQGFVVQAGEDVRRVVVQAFDNAWATGTLWS